MANAKIGQNDIMVKKAISGLGQEKITKLKEELEQWKRIPVKIAVIGQSGSGKNLRIRGLFVQSIKLIISCNIFTCSVKIKTIARI